jgi:hypothetical protein
VKNGGGDFFCKIRAKKSPSKMAVFEGKICALPQNIVTLQHI